MSDAFDVDAGITGILARDMAALQYETLPANTIEFAKHCFLDWLGVTIAGSQEPLSRIMQAEAESDGATGPCTLIGTGLSSSPSWAAAINGAASHALDFDDVVSAMGGHPSVPVFPAILALAQARPASEPTSGRDFLTAFIAGFETECRVGTLVAPNHYARGFHATGTVGTFGAAAACAHLMQQDVDTWTMTLGLAGAQAAGLKCMFGTMAKPLHAGKAASNGLLASRLAQRGFTAHPQVLEAEQGFAATQTDSYNPQAFLAMRQADGITKVMFKYHAACFLTHASIEAAIRLREQHALHASDIASVDVYVPPGHLRVCNIQSPTTGLEGKFSLRLTVSLALNGLDTSERAFTDEGVLAPDVLALRDKVRIHAVNDLSNHYSSRIRVVSASGEELMGAADISAPTSAAELPRQWQKLATKFLALSEPVIGQDKATQLLQRISDLETASDISEIIRLTKAEA